MDEVPWKSALLALAATLWTAPAVAAPFLFVANHGADSISIVDTATNKSIATLPVGRQPFGLAVDPDGAHVYVGNFYSETLSIITTATEAGTSIPIGSTPKGIALKPPGTRVYVAGRDGNIVTVLDSATNEVVTTIPVGNSPMGIAVNPAGNPAYVVNKSDDSMTVFDTETNEVLTTVPVYVNPTHVAVSPAGDRIYVTNYTHSQVTVLNATTLDVTGSVTVGSFPEGVTFSPDGTRGYVAASGPGTLAVIDTALQTLLTTIPVGKDPEDVAVHPDGTRVYVMNHADATVSVIDTASNTEIDTDGNPANGMTRIAVGFGPLARGQPIIPALRPPRLSKPALACQAMIAAQARAFATVDQGQRTACHNLVRKALASGNGSHEAETTCALELDVGNPSSALARARSHTDKAIVKKCAGVDVTSLNRPCDREAGSIENATACILDHHEKRVAEMDAETFAADSTPLTKAARVCQGAIASAASRFATSEHAGLANCLLRVLKDAAQQKNVELSAAACAKTLDPQEPGATLPKVRAGLVAKIAKKCAGVVPAAIGNPCDAAATTIAQIASCVLGAQASRVEKMVGAEFNDACSMLTAAGLGRAYPGVCSYRPHLP